jgi:hypothetical protein
VPNRPDFDFEDALEFEVIDPFEGVFTFNKEHLKTALKDFIDPDSKGVSETAFYNGTRPRNNEEEIEGTEDQEEEEEEEEEEEREEKKITKEKKKLTPTTLESLLYEHGRRHNGFFTERDEDVIQDWIDAVEHSVDIDSVMKLTDVKNEKPNRFILPTIIQVSTNVVIFRLFPGVAGSFGNWWMLYDNFDGDYIKGPMKFDMTLAYAFNVAVGANKKIKKVAGPVIDSESAPETIYSKTGDTTQFTTIMSQMKLS